MKKLIITLAIAISSLSAIAGEENVSKKVLDAFKIEFSTAKEVEWTIGKDYYKAAFLYNNNYVFAFYDFDGGLLAVTRYISPVDLPISLQIGLKNNSEGLWVSDLFEMAKNGVTSYFIT
ncbi:MAG: hypothetical protein ACRDEB_07155, partial [Chitinophagaceae bacterium]